MNPLDQLADISVPNEVALWPLAWGYWVAIVLTIALIVLSIVALLKRIRLHKTKKAALAYIASLANNDPQFATKIQIRLKRLCEHYFELCNANVMFGEQWKTFLRSHYKGAKPADLADALDLINVSIYNAKADLSEAETQAQNEMIKNAIVDWIRSSVPANKTNVSAGVLPVQDTNAAAPAGGVGDV